MPAAIREERWTAVGTHGVVAQVWSSYAAKEQREGNREMGISYRIEGGNGNHNSLAINLPNAAALMGAALSTGESLPLIFSPQRGSRDLCTEQLNSLQLYEQLQPGQAQCDHCRLCRSTARGAQAAQGGDAQAMQTVKNCSRTAKQRTPSHKLCCWLPALVAAVPRSALVHGGWLLD